MLLRSRLFHWAHASVASVLVALLALATHTAASSESAAQRVTDWHPGKTFHGAGYPAVAGLVSAGSRVFFRAYDQEGGFSVWVSDGTEAGTHIAVDVSPSRSDVVWPGSLAVIGSRVQFTMQESEASYGIYSSDGTSEGTQRILPNDWAAAITDPQFTAIGDAAVFTADRNPVGEELWSNTSEPESARLVKDIRPGSESSTPRNLTQVGDVVFFTADDGTHGRELWKSDGTAQGTVLVRDIAPSADSFFGIDSANSPTFQAVGDRLFIRKSGLSGSQQIWVSDGTEQGTFELLSVQDSKMAALDGMLYFTGDVIAPGHGGGLWRSDGTVNGTQLVARFGVELPASAALVGTANRKLLLLDNANHLWASDGSSAPATRVTDPSIGTIANLRLLGAAGTSTYFLTTIGNTIGLWRTDGSATGEVYLRDLLSSQGMPPDLAEWFAAAAGDRLLFSRWDTSFPGLWVSDGSTSGTRLLIDPTVMAAGLDQGAGRPITNAGGQLFFSVNEQNGTQLWTSDGTEAGTQIVRDVAAGTYFNLPLMLGSQRMFIGSDDQGFALWRTDGTSAGTTVALRLTDVNDVVRATVFNNILYFFDLEATGISLWRSDATAAGTYKVTQIRSDTNRPIPSTIVKSGDKFYFLAADSQHGYELWASNGTAGGTEMLLDLDPEAYSSQLSALTDVEGTLYFVRESPPYEKFELWKSQGTAASTSKVANLPHYYDEVYNVKRGPQQLTSAGGKLFFTIQEDSRGYRLWVSDGSAQGTKRVQGADGPTIAREPRQMVRFGDVLLFAASGDRHGDELWRSDGTAAGTYRVKDIAPGPADSGIFTLTALGDERQALFAATDGLRGSEVWVTDGTTQGTWRVEDIASGPRSANPTQFTEVNSSIFFFANDHISGRELWVMPRSALVLPPATPTASPTPSTTPIPSSTPTQRPEAYNMYLPTLQR